MARKAILGLVCVSLACGSTGGPNMSMVEVVDVYDENTLEMPRSTDSMATSDIHNEDGRGQFDADYREETGELVVQDLPAAQDASPELLEEVDSGCNPQCGEAECGDDGCGGSCGECNDNNVCTDDGCEQGLCIFTSNKAECDDDNLCTVGDQCKNGSCQPGEFELICSDDDNPCTDDCNPKDGCSHIPNDNNICLDGTVCNGEETCLGGVCLGGIPLDCDDGNPCTTDDCDSETGCIHENLGAGIECGGWLLCDGNGNCLPCEPQCDDKECGDDACGGVCGVCGEKLPECVEGQCVCFPDCDDKECGADGCGDDCGSCQDPQDECIEGQCVCQPTCEGKECGDNGCGGLCQLCPGSQDICDEGTCVCLPACDGKVCGGDGCGGSCGECTELEDCLGDGFCVCKIACADECCISGSVCGLDGECCQPDCAGNECGDNGCGGLCGECWGQTLCSYTDECISPVPMVEVPKGSFWWGFDKDNSFSTEVNIDYAYLIDKYPVTSIDYGTCVFSGVCDEPIFTKLEEEPDNEKKWGTWVSRFENPKYPVTGISWSQAKTYCEWQGKRLCSDTEWEKAVFGAGDSPGNWPWGPTYVNGNACVGSWNFCCSVGDHPQGASQFGLEDAINGQHREWVEDCAHNAPNPWTEEGGINTDGSPWLEPCLEVDGVEWKAVKYAYQGGYHHTTSWGIPDDPYYYTGVRCCQDM